MTFYEIFHVLEKNYALHLQVIPKTLLIVYLYICRNTLLVLLKPKFSESDIKFPMNCYSVFETASCNKDHDWLDVWRRTSAMIIWYLKTWFINNSKWFLPTSFGTTYIQWNIAGTDSWSVERRHPVSARNIFEIF